MTPMPDRYGQPTDLDDNNRDPYPPPWHAARPPRRTPGPVLETYADTDALEVACIPGCGQPVGELCRHPDGTQRKMPCPKRITRAAAHIAKARGTA